MYIDARLRRPSRASKIFDFTSPRGPTVSTKAAFPPTGGYDTFGVYPKLRYPLEVKSLILLALSKTYGFTICRECLTLPTREGPDKNSVLSGEGAASSGVG
jgi:hypothetical protein